MTKSSTYRKILLLAAFFCVSAIIMAQAPQLISYQAVVRDAGSQPMANTSVSVIMTINYLTYDGTQVFTESHNPTTNDYGLINIMLGYGTGSDNLDDVDWSLSPYFLNITIDGNEMDPVLLMSVPYAFYANEAGNVFSGDYNDLDNLPTLYTGNWNTAYGWGNHALANYITTSQEEDPVFGHHVAAGIGVNDITDWTTAFKWGDHALANYITNAQENDPVFKGHDASSISSGDMDNWDDAFSWGDHSTRGYMDSKWELNGSTIHNPDGFNLNLGSDQPSTGVLTITSDPTAAPEDPAFQIINQAGFVVFEVLNNGTVEINFDEGTKGPKGGFAIGGFDASKGLKQPYLMIDPDSTRLYFNEADAKGPKGGFAIGGFDPVKGGTIDKYVEVRGDRGTTGNNVFLGQNSGGETGYNSSSNIAIGMDAGLALTSGATNNVFIGDSAGLETSYGDYSVFIGRNVGSNMWNGYNNVYIGYRAGSEGHGQYNVFIGNEAGRKNDGGFANVLIGDKAGTSVIGGYRNTFVGSQAGQKVDTGNENTFIGTSSGMIAEGAGNNTLVGYLSGYSLVDGNSNVFIGHGAGFATEGSSNIFIGKSIGSGIAASDYRLLIDCTASTVESAFISGVMSGVKTLRFNASTAIKTAPEPGYDLTVAGSIHAVSLFESSDARLKSNIQTIVNPLAKVLNLRGVTFNWNKEGIPNDKKSIGFIAQEAVNVIPELVSKGSTYYSMNYAPITALLVEAVKELKKENDELRSELSRVDELEAQIEELRSIITGASEK